MWQSHATIVAVIAAGLVGGLLAGCTRQQQVEEEEAEPPHYLEAYVADAALCFAQGRWVLHDGERELAVFGEFGQTLLLGEQASLATLGEAVRTLYAVRTALWGLHCEVGPPPIEPAFTLTNAALRIKLNWSKDRQVYDLASTDGRLLARFSADGRPLWVSTAERTKWFNTAVGWGLREIYLSKHKE